MAQLIVRNLEDSIRDKIRALAAAHGRSMEEEVREILRAAALKVTRQPRKGLGSRLVDHFQGCTLGEGELKELRRQEPRAAEFDA